MLLRSFQGLLLLTVGWMLLGRLLSFVKNMMKGRDKKVVMDCTMELMGIRE